MSIEFVNPPELAEPRGFSHAVVGTGRTVFLAGQTALNQDGVIVGETVVEQFDQALGNIVTALRAAGGTPRSEEHTSELQSRGHLVCRLLLEKKKTTAEVR